MRVGTTERRLRGQVSVVAARRGGGMCGAKPRLRPACRPPRSARSTTAVPPSDAAATQNAASPAGSRGDSPMNMPHERIAQRGQNLTHHGPDHPQRMTRRHPALLINTRKQTNPIPVSAVHQTLKRITTAQPLRGFSATCQRDKPFLAIEECPALHRIRCQSNVTAHSAGQRFELDGEDSRSGGAISTNKGNPSCFCS